MNLLACEVEVAIYTSDSLRTELRRVFFHQREVAALAYEEQFRIFWSRQDQVIDHVPDLGGKLQEPFVHGIDYSMDGSLESNAGGSNPGGGIPGGGIPSGSDPCVTVSSEPMLPFHLESGELPVVSE